MSPSHHPQRRTAALVEQLERRQLLAANPVVMDLRLPGGGRSVTVTGEGQVINFEVWATVTGTDNDPSNEGFQLVTGALRSTNITEGAALGTLQVTPVAPFNGTGATSGTQADLDGDTDLDVGSTDPSSAVGFFGVRSGSMETSGTVVGTNSKEFKVGTGTFTVTGLLSGVQTDLVWGVRAANTGFTYQVDGQHVTGTLNAGSVAAGEGIVLKRPGTASIKGRVFDDKNANGIFDGSDTGIDGFRVFLDENANGVLDDGEVSKPVSSVGTYTFTNVVAGTYRVREVFREGWRQSFPALGFYETTLRYGDIAKSQSFANTDTIVIKGKVWNDLNANKAIDLGEPGMPGWYVYVDHNNDGVFNKGDDWSLSDSKGNYRFFNLPAGTYNVRIAQISTWRLTTPTSGVRVLTLAAGQTTSNKNFGEKRIV